MEETQNTQEFISVLMPSEMVKQIEQMAKEDDADRSKVIRRLINREIARRKRRREARATSRVAQPTH